MSTTNRMARKINTTRVNSAGSGLRPAGVGPSVSSIESTRAKVVFLLSVVRHWGAVCIPLGLLLAVGAAAGAWFLWKPGYQAMAWIRIEDKRPVVLSDVKAEADSKKFVATQVQLIHSPLVVGQVLKEPNVATLSQIKNAESPVDWIGDRLTVTPVGESELYNIQFDGPSPEVVAIVANAVVDAYMELHSQRDAGESQRLLELLENEKERHAMEVERLQENVRVLTKRVTGKDPILGNTGPGAPLVIAPTSADETRLAETEVEREMLEVKLRTYQESLANKTVEIPEVLISEAIESQDRVLELRTEIKTIEARIAQLIELSAKGNEDPRVQQAKREFSKQKESLEQLRQELHGEVLAELQAAELMKREAEVTQLKEEIADKLGLEVLFKQRIEDRLRQREDLGGQALELEFARSELARANTVYQQISEKVTELRTEMRAPTRVSLQKAATPPVEPAPNKRLPITLLAALIALFLPLGLAIVWEGFVRHIVEAEQVEEMTGVNVIGEIAALPSRRRFKPGGKEQYRRHESLYEESIDSLRTSLAVSDEMKDVKVLSVASAVSSEGKTSLASQLAVSLARASGDATLLIDGDMRAPDLHAIFEISNDRGLADVLDGKCSVKDAIVTNWHDHLHLMPAGRLRRSPYALLGSGHLTSMLDELRGTYRYIVIDGPPVLSASEALIIAKASDGAILCTMKDRTRAPQLRLANQKLEQAGVRVLGAVLSGVPARSYAYKYGGYYYYGNQVEANRGGGNNNGQEAGKVETADRNA